MPTKKTSSPSKTRTTQRASATSVPVDTASAEPTPTVPIKRSRKSLAAAVPVPDQAVDASAVQDEAVLAAKKKGPPRKVAKKALGAAAAGVLELREAKPEPVAVLEMPQEPVSRPAPAWQLDDEQRAMLHSILAQAQQSPPSDWLRFHLGRWAIGHIAPAHVDAVRDALPLCHVSGQRLIWAAQDLTPAERSEMIGAAALRLRDAGLIPGWRHEDYRCELPHPGAQDLLGGELFRLERAAFRFFGLRSRAVHINGFTERGLWCGRRALSKPTDPGMLDNLAAGGLGAGEDLQLCAVRELGEEAGMAPEATLALQLEGCLHSARVVGLSEGEGAPLGWHDEILHVFKLRLPEDFVPHNRDGEVAEFLHLGGLDLLERLSRQEFTPDAGAVTAWGLLGRN